MTSGVTEEDEEGFLIISSSSLYILNVSPWSLYNGIILRSNHAFFTWLYRRRPWLKGCANVCSAPACLHVHICNSSDHALGKFKLSSFTVGWPLTSADNRGPEDGNEVQGSGTQSLPTQAQIHTVRPSPPPPYKCATPTKGRDAFSRMHPFSSEPSGPSSVGFRFPGNPATRRRHPCTNKPPSGTEMGSDLCPSSSSGWRIWVMLFREYSSFHRVALLQSSSLLVSSLLGRHLKRWVLQRALTLFCLCQGPKRFPLTHIHPVFVP